MSEFRFPTREDDLRTARDVLEKSGIAAALPKAQTFPASWRDSLRFVTRGAKRFVAAMALGAIVVTCCGTPVAYAAPIPLVLAAGVAFTQGRSSCARAKKLAKERDRCVQYFISTNGPARIKEEVEDAVSDIVHGISNVWWPAAVWWSIRSLHLKGQAPPSVLDGVELLWKLDKVLDELFNVVDRAYIHHESITPWIDRWLASNETALPEIIRFMRLMREVSEAAEPARQFKRQEAAERKRRDAEWAEARRRREAEEEAARGRYIANMPSLWPRSIEAVNLQNRAIEDAKLQIRMTRSSLTSQIDSLREARLGFLQRGEYHQADAVDQRIQGLKQVIDQTSYLT